MSPDLHLKIDDGTSHNAANFSFAGARPGEPVGTDWHGGAVIRRDSGSRRQDPGPQAPPLMFKVERIPAEPHPGPPPLPVEEIIHKFAANEDVMKKAYDTYDFTQSIRLDELSDPEGSA